MRRALHPLALVLLIASCSAAIAQRQNDVWYFGYRVGLDFSSGAPAPLVNGATDQSEGTAVISDRTTGRLLFYTDGMTVWNRNHAVMPNGTGLLGNQSSTQSALIIPAPGDPLRYYIFTSDAVGGPGGINYSIVDMRNDGGRGSVVQKNALVKRPAAEKLVAVELCEGGDHWVIAHGRPVSPTGNSDDPGPPNDTFWVIKVSDLGVSAPVAWNVGSLSTGNVQEGIGYLKASPDGSMLAKVDFRLPGLLLTSFDKASGAITNPIVVSVPGDPHYLYGASFSPDNSKLYVTSWIGSTSYVYQFDLSVKTKAAIDASATLIATVAGGPYMSALQLGPDGKLYISRFEHPALDVIEFPNLKGAASTYRADAITFSSGIVRWGLPNMIDAHVTRGVDTSVASPDASICAGSSTTLRGSGGTAYRWSPATGLNCTDCPSPVASPSVSTTYRVTVTGGAGCGRSDSVRVTVRPLPRASAGADARICAGSSITLNASGGRSYTWSPSSGLSCTDCASPVASPTSTTDYVVTVTDSNGCQARDTVRVTVDEAPLAYAGLDGIVCAGSSLQLRGSGGLSYRWTPAEDLSCDTCAEPFASPKRTTTYRLVVRNATGCESSDSVTVTVLDAPPTSAGADTILCRGSSLQLRATGASTYRWRSHPDLPCLDCAEPLVTPSTTATYYVTGRSENGCESTDSITVTVVDAPMLLFTGDTIVCREQSGQLRVSGATSYAWRQHPDLSCTDCADPIVTPSQTTTYYVTGMVGSGCSTLDSVTVVVADRPSLLLSGDSTICIGGSARISAQGGASYSWRASSGETICADCQQQSVSPTATTTYYVTATSDHGCATIDSFVVRVVGKPEVIASGGTICDGESIRLNASGATSYRWEPSAGLSCDDCADPVASPATTTTYRVIGSIAGGCSDTTSVTVTVQEAATVIASLPRNVGLVLGQRATLSLEIDKPIIADTLRFELSWHEGVVYLDDVRPSASLASDGWSHEVVERGDDYYRGIFVRSGAASVSAGRIIEITISGYVADSAATELPFVLQANSGCLAIDSRAGRVSIDSICGLDLRLITLGKAALRLDNTAPNPIHDEGLVRYSLPFDGEAEVTMIDAAGNVRSLRDGYHNAGEHELMLDAAEMASGAYTLRLRFGEMTTEVRVVVAR